MSQGPALVGDIGGTNIRFGLATQLGPTPKIEAVFSAPCASYGGLQEALAGYLRDKGAPRPSRICLAVAGPVVDGAVELTNSFWEVSEPELKAAGYDQALLLNDFAALAISTTILGPDDLIPIGPAGMPRQDEPRLVIGPGTGLGVGVLAPTPRGPHVLATEAGHMAFAPTDAMERALLAQLQVESDRVSLEDLLSGPGLATLHQVLTGLKGPIHESEITRAALAGDADCRRTIDRFTRILGSAAGDLALAYSARGGVYFAGGILPRIASIADWTGLRHRFEDKGKMARHLQGVPTQLIKRADAALAGCALALA